MDPALILIAGLFAMLALPFVALGLVVSTRHAARLGRELTAARNRLAILERQPPRRRPPEDFPPGTIPVELGLAVHEEWRKAGYHMVGDTRVVLRLLSIAHRVMCEHQPNSLAPSFFNDGDRSPPAMVACMAQRGSPCRYPDCTCEAIEPTPPPPIKRETKR